MTTPLSMRVRQTIESFAARMGVTPRAAADHSYGFEFYRLGTFSILQSDDGERAIVSLAQNSYRADSAMRKRLLNLTGFDLPSSTTVHAGMTRDGTFVLAVALDAVNLSVQSLDEVLFRLSELYNSIS
jgi:hypothetical protein